MSAGRPAAHAEGVGVEVVFLRAGAEEPHGLLAVLNLCGEHRVLTQPIINGSNGVALREEMQQGIPAVLAPRTPSTTMHPDQEWQRLLGLRHEQVERVP